MSILKEFINVSGNEYKDSKEYPSPFGLVENRKIAQTPHATLGQSIRPRHQLLCHIERQKHEPDNDKKVANNAE